MLVSIYVDSLLHQTHSLGDHYSPDYSRLVNLSTFARRGIPPPFMNHVFIPAFGVDDYIAPIFLRTVCPTLYPFTPCPQDLPFQHLILFLELILRSHSCWPTSRAFWRGL